MPALVVMPVMCIRIVRMLVRHRIVADIVDAYARHEENLSR